MNAWMKVGILSLAAILGIGWYIGGVMSEAGQEREERKWGDRYDYGKGSSRRRRRQTSGW
jgi:hypothetical protein